MAQVKRKLKARVKTRQGLGSDYFILDFEAPAIAADARPGQFVMITVSNTMDPLLPRPFSILETDEHTVSLLIKKVGRGTRVLYNLMTGSEVDMVGPLGIGFPEVDRAVLVAGGYGVAPFFYLVKQKGDHQAYEFCCGGETVNDVLFLPQFEQRLGRNHCHITTEDGSLGRKGLVTDALKRVLDENEPRPKAVFACGPTPMLRAVHDLSGEYGVPAYVSMENIMGCGYGVCLGCVVPTTSGMIRVCREGPVLDSRKILWEQL